MGDLVGDLMGDLVGDLVGDLLGDLGDATSGIVMKEAEIEMRRSIK